MSVLLATVVVASEDRVVADSVYRLQQQGWAITQKVDRVESRAGVPPYQHLVRRVSISTYRVGPSYRVKQIEGRRGGAMMISIMEMDSGVPTSS